MLKQIFAPSERKVIALSALGGALEFYEFIIYVFFANEISELFFPQTSHYAALMGAYLVFAAGYFIRPLGGIIFSHFGDKVGRKKTFVITLIMMALPTLGMGLLPTYQAIGNFAPLLLVLLRVMQGLSVGGEIPGAVTFVSEHVEAERRGFTCALMSFAVNIGMVLGSLTCTIMLFAFSHEQILAWAWRIPFIVGGCFGLLSFKLRSGLVETPLFEKMKTHQAKFKFPLLEVLKRHRRALLQGIGIVWLDAVIICLLFLYLPNYLTSVLHYAKQTVNVLNTCTMILQSCLFVLFGFFSDRFGRKIFLSIGALGFMIFGYSLFYFVAKEHIFNLVLVYISIAVVSACITGVYLCSVIEMFPTQVRYTGMALTYNIGFGLFGAISPLVSTYLINATGNILSPSFYLMLSACMCFIAVRTVQEKYM